MTTRRHFLAGSGALTASIGAAALPLPATPDNAAEAAFRPDDWASVRAQFRLAPDYVHLSNFFLASLPRPVRDAMAAYRQALDDNPFTYLQDNMFRREEDMIWRDISAAAAEYVGGQASEIALTTSTTVGLALLYNGIRLKPHQEILTTTHEHFPHHESMRLAVEKGGGSIRKISLYENPLTTSPAEMVARLRDAIRPHTRLIGLTWVHSSTGMRLPLRQMADVVAEANRGRDPADQALLVVDGVHGFGVVDVDVASLGCDFFCAGTHKWILAPSGTGIVWGKSDSWQHVQPTVPTLMGSAPLAAWLTGIAPSGPTQASWISPGGLAAFEHQWAMIEAFRFHKQIGRARIWHRIADLNGQLKDGLARIGKVTQFTPRDPALSAGFVSFTVLGRTPAQVVQKLFERKIVASVAPYKVPYVRLSAGIVNTQQDIDSALRAVRALA
jgi:isopenicillin-N epimerase